jgi:hypothetical protein
MLAVSVVFLLLAMRFLIQDESSRLDRAAALGEPLQKSAPAGS